MVGMNTLDSTTVFISADITDVPDTLFTLTRVITQLGGLPVTSQYSPAAGEYDWGTVRQIIDRCDIYILLVGDTYGVQAETGESYIHREAVYAKSKLKPVIALLKNEVKLTDEEVPRLRSLHRLMMSGVFKFWSSQEDLLLIGRQVLREHLKPQLGITGDGTGAPPVLTPLHDDLMELESYPIRMTGKVFAHGNCHEVTRKIYLTWETTFLNVGAMMTSPVTEDRMKSVIEDYVEEYFQSEFMEGVPDAHAVADVRCNDIEFQRLKAYLKGAGMIENVSGFQGGVRIYWQLTPVGETKLNQLLSRH